MAEEKQPQILRAVGFVAETLEKEAARRAETSKEEAEPLLETAKKFRASDYPRLVKRIEE